MCSILGILDIKSDPDLLRERALHLSRLLRHRGPDWSGIFSNDRVVLAHERLSIVDVSHGAQPLTSSDECLILAVNGEIYNHRSLRDGLSSSYPFKTESDCEVILALYEEHGTGFLNKLNGIFAFILYDTLRDRYLIARDHLGIIPLYTGHDEEGNFYAASEMKALVPTCRTVTEFPPGHFLDSVKGYPERYYTKAWRDYGAISGDGSTGNEIRQAMEAAVQRQLMSDVPYGVLLSGGLDSSIIAATAAKFAGARVEDEGRSPAWWPRMHTFAIGLEGSPDLDAARTAAEHIDSVHHEFVFTIQEGLDALSDVVYHLETYDVTTIRASTPMYLMARRIRAMGIKMVLSGEGADEIFGGYLYFHKAPDEQAFHEETVRKLDRLHLFDLLRANKSMAAWGVETRVPFLDREFLDVAMNVDAGKKMARHGRMEKQLLRDAFADILPESIINRQKEQFSDGVGYGWIDSLRAFAQEKVSDAELETAAFRFPVNPPASKEEYLYRSLFSRHFPSDDCARCVVGGPSVACSTPEALAWDRAFSDMPDPSGRAVRGIHSKSY